MAALKRIYIYAFDGRPIPKGYFRPEPHIVDGPFQARRSGNHSPAPAARFVDDEWLSLPAKREKAAGVSERLQGNPADALEKVRGVEVAVLDALRYTPHPTHMCLDEALTAARRIGAARTYFTHLTHDYDHDQAQAELPSGVTLAYDGLKVACDS